MRLRLLCISILLLGTHYTYSMKIQRKEQRVPQCPNMHTMELTKESFSTRKIATFYVGYSWEKIDDNTIQIYKIEKDGPTTSGFSVKVNHQTLLPVTVTFIQKYFDTHNIEANGAPSTLFVTLKKLIEKQKRISKTTYTEKYY